jgi:hypothetical protein
MKKMKKLAILGKVLTKAEQARFMGGTGEEELPGEGATCLSNPTAKCESNDDCGLDCECYLPTGGENKMCLSIR